MCKLIFQRESDEGYILPNSDLELFKKYIQFSVTYFLYQVVFIVSVFVSFNSAEGRYLRMTPVSLPTYSTGKFLA